MSEVPQYSNELRMLSESIAQDRNAAPIDSSPRYSLVASGENIDFFVRDPETGEKQRFLLAIETNKSLSYYDVLAASGLPQFHKRKIASQLSVYEIPIHVKPFHHEQVTANEPSTDTHISGVELFEHFGAVWRSVFEATSAMPENPMRATAINNTVDLDNALIPIPPYTNWIQDVRNPKDVAIGFITRVESELQRTYPDASHSELIAATHKGWSRE
jgi:hypothetical protein